MFTGLILLAVLALLAVAAVSAAVKAAISAVRKASSGQKKEEAVKEEKPEERKSRQKEEAPAQQQESLPEETVSQEWEESISRLQEQGIGEAFWTEKTDIELDGKALADLVVSGTSLSYMEFNNRHLAGDGFMGFNIEIKDGEKMALTYRGNVLVTLTKVTEKVPEPKEGEPEEKVMYRTNVFPPFFGKDMAVSELADLLQITGAVSECGGDPCLVADVMLGVFSQDSNIRHLRADIDGKIREKETQRLREEQQKSRNEKQPVVLQVKHSV